MEYEIWHNPGCSKSRAALAILTEAGVRVRVREYLNDPPGATQIAAALDALGCEAVEIARTSDRWARDMELPDPAASRSEWIATLCRYPRLLERPIVLASDGRAVLGRPPEAVRALL